MTKNKNKNSSEFKSEPKILFDSLNRKRVKGRLYSENPKRNIIRLTDDEKKLIIFIRSISINDNECIKKIFFIIHNFFY